MDMNPGVTILFGEKPSVMVNRNSYVWAKDYETAREAVEDAVRARLIRQSQADEMLREGRGYMGSPLQYYEPALRQCGFREYPPEPRKQANKG